MKSEVNLLVTLRSTEDKVEEVKEILGTLCRLSREEEGCLEYRSAKAEGEPTFYIKECWADEASLKAHEQTTHFLECGPKLGASCSSVEIKRVNWESVL
ncbi:putative quinol monooxygenase [Vibrio hannami]|uniref:putative quinol monooxygenase n=1 Tax=Vibrio hannami TaxID=2717094 RepID=UPI00240FF7DD|nr:putative quinol monooxygenase [Vibrio hannami]MDG3086361.1 putative quinol monooxygenase [Vibrio hannami]